jgi:hypothetical protein
MRAVLMSGVTAVLLAASAASVVSAPVATGDDNIYGLVTPDEQQEIWANGQRNCVTLDGLAESNPPLTSDGVKTVIQSYLDNGWDLESAGDIVWESIEGRCPEYMPQVKIAMRSYGDAS